MNTPQHSEVDILQQIISLLEQLRDIRQTASGTEMPVLSQQQFFKSLVHHALDMFLVIDPDGTIRYVNSAVKPHLGYRQDELEGRSIYDFLHEDDHPTVQDNLSRVIASPGKTLPVFTLRMQTKEESWRTLESVGKNLLHEDVVSGILLTTRDITERDELEQQLQRAQRMEALGLIAGSIAHDFRNLMAVILGSAQMLQLDPTEAEKEKFLEMIVSSVDRGKTITQRILAFAHTEKPHFQTLSGQQYLENVREIASRTLPENIEIVVEPYHDDDLIKADPGQLQQVLLILCTNAADAMPSGGKITLALERPTTELARKHRVPSRDNYLCITVTDTGSGMDDETLNRIFEPFFTTKEAGNATGLGLSVAYGILEQHQGWIDAVSEVDKGTTIILGLPRAEEKEESPEPINFRQPSTSAKHHILIVEDEAHLRELLETILISKGYTVSVASNGKDALLLYKGKAKDIQLIITDLKMPEMGGQELARRVHEINPQLKIIAITGSMGLERPKVTPNNTFKAVIEKPFDVQEVLRTIQEVLNGDSN